MFGEFNHALTLVLDNNVSVVADGVEMEGSRINVVETRRGLVGISAGNFRSDPSTSKYMFSNSYFTDS